MAEGLVRLAPANAHAAYSFCARHPEHCTYIAGWIREGGLLQDPRVPKAWLLGLLRPEDQVDGLVYISETGIVLPVLPESLTDSLLKVAKKNPSLIRVLVGERALVRTIWQDLERQGMVARLVREQLGYVATQETFQGTRDLALELGREEHLDQLVVASAEMAKEEAQDDPYSRNPSLFEQRIRERILRGRDFVHLREGHLTFKTNISALSTLGGQVEGIYTVPEYRRQGLGRRGTSTITRWVLRRAKRAFLLVNQDNDAAKKIYEEIGYQRVLSSQTIFIA